MNVLYFILVAICSFLSFNHQAMAQGRSSRELTKVDLNSLTPEQLEKFDFRYKDFSITIGDLKYPGLFKGKDLQGSALAGLDLSQSGIEEASSLFAVDFTGVKNPPQDFVKGKNIFKAKLTGLDLTWIGITLATDLRSVDFTGTTNAPKNFVKDRDISNSILNGLHLTDIGIDKADSIMGINFIGSTNPPLNFAVGKDLSNCKLSGLNLTDIGILYATRFIGTDFSGSTNPPDYFVRGKDVSEAIFENFDLAKIGIDLTSSTEGLVISNGITLSEDIIIHNSFQWDIRGPITYRGMELNEKQFSNLQDLFEMIEKTSGSEHLIPLYIDKLIGSMGLEKLVNLEYQEMNKIPLAKMVRAEDILAVLPSKCREIFKGIDIDPSWFKISELIGLPLNPQRFYRQLFHHCAVQESKKKGKLARPEIVELRKTLRAKMVDNQELNEIPANDQQLVVERHQPDEALNLYLAHVKAREKRNPVRIVFKDENGIDGGGLRREFFYMMGKVMRERMNKEISMPNPMTDFATLGMMTARTVAVERDIPAFSIDAPLEFYRRILQQDLVKWMVESVYNVRQENYDDQVIKVKSIVKILQDSVDQYRITMDIDSCSYKDISQTFLDSCSNFSECARDNISNFVVGFQKILSHKDLENLGIESAQDLKDFIEGSVVVSRKDFFKHFKIQAKDKIFKKAYKMAIKEILDDLSLIDPSGAKVQTFIQDFFRYATGSPSLGGNHFTLKVSLDKKLLPFARTCGKVLECPMIDNVAGIKASILKAISLVDEGFGFD